MSEEQYEKFKKYISEYLVGEEQQIQILWTGIQAAKLSNTVPAFLLRGPPGSGKTYITKLIAEYLNAAYIFIQATLNTSEEELVYKYIPSENSKSGVKILYGPLPEALIKSHQKLTVLTIDEFDKTRPSADALLLDFLQNARISFRIDDNQEEIEGNRNNLIVFLTSNENREFSEPLLRRLIVVDFLPPSPQAVKQILQKHFDEKIVKLLTRIYVAGLNAGLSKPITIQELLQFGHALQITPDTNFNDILYSFVIKNIEDMQKLDEALNNETQNQIQEGIPDVAQALVQHQEQELQEQQEEEEQKQESVQQILAQIKVPKEESIVAEKITNAEEKTFSANVSQDFKEYSTIVTTFEPAPAERPDVLGTFQFVLDETNFKLTSSTPLSLEEIQKLTETSMNFEVYTEDYLYFQNIYSDIINIVKGNKLNFTYYTKNILIAKNERTILRFELLKDKLFQLKMYMKYTGEEKKLLEHLLAFQIDIVLKNFLGNLQWRHYDVMSGKYFTTQEYKDLVEFLKITGIKAKLIIDVAPNLYIATMHGKTEIRYTISSDVNDNYVKYTINRLDIATEKTDNISNNIKNIINQYAGTYNLLEGLNIFKKMTEEIQNYIGDQQ